MPTCLIAANNMQDLAKQFKTEIAHHLPAILAKPLQLAPFPLQKQLVTRVLTHIFQLSLDDGDMDFLIGHSIRFEIEDCGLQWTYTYDGHSLQMLNQHQAEASIRCKMRDVVLLANRRADPDTLFFQRKLVIEGDTELGLTMKNLMDTIEADTLPTPISKGLQVMEQLLNP